MLGLLCALSNQIIAQCAGRRADIYEFSPEERMELRNLMMDYLRSDIDDTRPEILRYTAVGIHSGFDDNSGAPPNPWTDGEPLFCEQPTGGSIGIQPLRIVNEDYIDENDLNYDGLSNDIIKII